MQTRPADEAHRSKLLIPPDRSCSLLPPPDPSWLLRQVQTRPAGGAPGSPSKLYQSLSSTALVSSSSNGMASLTAARRRRAVEIASAEERRRVELRAAKATAGRALQLEQRHAATLHQQMDLLSLGFSINLRVLELSMAEAEAEAEAAARHAALCIARADADGEAQLEMASELFQLQLTTTQENLALTTEELERVKEEAANREGAPRARSASRTFYGLPRPSVAFFQGPSMAFHLDVHGLFLACHGGLPLRPCTDLAPTLHRPCTDDRPSASLPQASCMRSSSNLASSCAAR